jgi:hypothetical protein
MGAMAEPFINPINKNLIQHDLVGLEDASKISVNNRTIYAIIDHFLWKMDRSSLNLTQIPSPNKDFGIIDVSASDRKVWVITNTRSVFSSEDDRIWKCENITLDQISVGKDSL